MSFLSWRRIAPVLGKLSVMWMAFYGANASAALDYSTCREFRAAVQQMNQNFPIEVSAPTQSQKEATENSVNKAWFPAVYEKAEVDCAEEEVTLHMRIATEDAADEIMQSPNSASVERIMAEFACRDDGFIKKWGLTETRVIYDFDGKQWEKFSITKSSCDALAAHASPKNQRTTTYLNAHQLKGFCASDSSSERASCQLYLVGLMDSYETLHQWGIAESRMCVPHGVSSEELLNTVREWLSKRPAKELASEAAGSHAVNAIGEQWPCTSRTSSEDGYAKPPKLVESQTPTNINSSATDIPIFGQCAENGSCFGDINQYGVPKTIQVKGYYRTDGTYVRGHYRGKPRK
jgi:hypothetical protein